ncbi:MAG TPA: hypothetical protein VNG69_17575 [Casimicrobiaceae bacterium]|nr:hypothetical protein [Casimicrobiaceae bacterium]
MKRLPSAIAGIVAIVWPVASHIATLVGRDAWLPSITAFAAIAILLVLIVAAAGVRQRGILTVALVMVALGWYFTPDLLVFLPPTAINVAFGMFFASTLLPGREPRIARYARLERGAALPDDIARYTRWLTWIWSVWFFAAAALSIVLALAAPLNVWSAFANVVNYVCVAVLFVGEYVYRRIRFRQHVHASLGTLLAVVINDRPLSSRRAST